MADRPGITAVLAPMLDLSHELHPDDLPALAEFLGGWDARLSFADLAQEDQVVSSSIARSVRVERPPRRCG